MAAPLPAVFSVVVAVSVGGVEGEVGVGEAQIQAPTRLVTYLLTRPPTLFQIWQ
jgi:hypothetical protein